MIVQAAKGVIIFIRKKYFEFWRFFQVIWHPWPLMTSEWPFQVTEMDHSIFKKSYVHIAIISRAFSRKTETEIPNSKNLYHMPPICDLWNQVKGQSKTQITEDVSFFVRITTENDYSIRIVHLFHQKKLPWIFGYFLHEIPRFWPWMTSEWPFQVM